MNQPSVYLYKELKGRYRVYLGEFSMAEGLSLFDSNLPIHFNQFVVSQSKPEAKSDEIESFELTKLNTNIKTVAEAIAFFEREQPPDLVDAEVVIDDDIRLSTHDDGECHFEFREKEMCMKILENVTTKTSNFRLFDFIVSHPGMYVKSDEEAFLIFDCFDDYIDHEVRD